MGVFNGNTTTQGLGGTGIHPSKSRNKQTESFKTTASIGSNKGAHGPKTGQMMTGGTYIESSSKQSYGGKGVKNANGMIVSVSENSAKKI